MAKSMQKGGSTGRKKLSNLRKKSGSTTPKRRTVSTKTTTTRTTGPSGIKIKKKSPTKVVASSAIKFKKKPSVASKQSGGVIKSGRPISAKAAARKTGKGKGMISKNIPNPSNKPGAYNRTKKVTIGVGGRKMSARKIVGKSRPIKKKK